MINKLEKNKKATLISDKVYSVVPFEGYSNHFLGINNENHIALLIKSSNKSQKKFTSYKGKNLKILFERVSRLSENGIEKSDKFTILHLNSEKKGLQSYFVEICKLILNNIGDNPDLSLVYNELENVKDIFLNLNKSRIKEEIGLWGELFLISIQRNKNKAIESWHINAKDRIDFNSGSIKIEVKTTLSNERKHVFKLNQLRNHYKEEVIVCSIMTSEIENGVSIKELLEEITLKLENRLKLKLLQKTSAVLGQDLFNLNYRRFDKKTAFESLQLFNSKDVPAIDLDCFDKYVSKISFTSNLSKVSNLVDKNHTSLFN